MNSSWQFVCSPAEQPGIAAPWAWRWEARVQNGEAQASPGDFPTLEECIAHARVCGYNPSAGDVTNLIDPRMAGTIPQTSFTY
jgi:hypothetical protein